MLDQYKAKMKDKVKPTTTCEWVRIDDVSEEKCTVTSIDEFMSMDNLKAVFEYRCNLKLQ